jgi:predicted nucleic acid-binding protein
MAIVADSGGIYALYDADDAHHGEVAAAMAKEPGPIIIPVAVLAEIDYLLRAHLGADAEIAFLDDLAEGGYALETLTPEDLLRCRELVEQYRGLDLGLADASVVATAERLHIQQLLTVDQRHFRAVIPANGQPFLLLPFDVTTERG